jgi:hypothetical protein
MRQPQEIEVWYVLPAIRREFAKGMIEKHGMSQKETASVLGVTDSAVSQYLKSKRAKEVEFSHRIKAAIEESVTRVVGDRSRLIMEMQGICDMLKKDRTLCRLHKSKSPGIPRSCNCCVEKKE